MKSIQKICVFVLLGSLLTATSLKAQEKYQDYFQVKAVPDTTQIRIGEPVKISLTAKVMLYALKGASVKVAFPILPDSLNHLEITDRTPLDTLGSDAQHKLWKQTVTLTSFDSGRWELPPMKFEIYSVTDGSYDSVFTDPIFIDVNTVKVDTTKAFKPIKDLRKVAWNLWDYWYFLAAAIIVVAALIFYIAYRNKNKAAPKAAPAKVDKPPYQAAMEALERLGKEKPWNSDVKLYYTQLTDILRQYFEQQFHIDAMEQTSAELLQNIKPVTQLNQQRDKLQAILTVADLAKFAKLQPSPQEHEDCLQKAVAIVEWTKPSATVANPADDSTNQQTQR